MSGDIKTWEAVQFVNAPLEGEFDDWPNSIKDAVYTAVEALAQKHQLPMKLAGARCDEDIDEPMDSPKRFFVHMIVSEIVVADERTLRPGRLEATTRKLLLQ